MRAIIMSSFIATKFFIIFFSMPQKENLFDVLFLFDF